MVARVSAQRRQSVPMKRRDLLLSALATSAIERSVLASALVTSTGASPVLWPQRASSSAPARSPSTARSATVKPELSARPRW